jgi:ABC-2 type transport system permease protein
LNGPFLGLRLMRVGTANGVRSAFRTAWGSRPRDRIAAGLALLGCVVFCGLELVALEAVLRLAARALAELPGVRNDVLVERCLLGVFAGLFLLSVLGNLTTAVSNLFLSEDLTARIPLPIPHRALFTRQLLLTLLVASGPMLLISGPAVLVAALHAQNPLRAALALAASIGAILILAASLASIAAVILVALIPPRRARLLAAFLSAAGLAIALISFRDARPERILDPAAAISVVLNLARTSVPSPGLSPTAWAAHSAAGALFQKPGALTTAALLFLGSALVLFSAAALAAPLHLRVFREVRAEDGSSPSRGRSGSPARSLMTMLLRAEMMSVAREASTPAQLGSLAAVFVLDLLNVRFLPASDATARDLLAGLQTALALFLVSALSLRFAYPSVSGDGRSASLLRSLPLSAARHLAARTVVRGVPSVLMALILIGASDAALRIPRGTILLSLFVGVLGAIAIPSLQMGLGALFPRYDAPHAVSVALGPGGLFAMTLSTGLSLSAAFVVSHELRGLVETLSGLAVTSTVVLLVWCLAAVALGAVPMVLAARSVGRSDLPTS